GPREPSRGDRETGFGHRRSDPRISRTLQGNHQAEVRHSQRGSGEGEDHAARNGYRQDPGRRGWFERTPQATNSPNGYEGGHLRHSKGWNVRQWVRLFSDTTISV